MLQTILKLHGNQSLEWISDLQCRKNGIFHFLVSKKSEHSKFPVRLCEQGFSCNSLRWGRSNPTQDHTDCHFWFGLLITGDILILHFTGDASPTTQICLISWFFFGKRDTIPLVGSSSGGNSEYANHYHLKYKDVTQRHRLFISLSETQNRIERNGVFHNLSAIQECQHCHFRFSSAIKNQQVQ